MARKMPPQTQRSESEENVPPRPNTIPRNYSSSGDSTLVASEGEAEGNPVESHEIVLQSADLTEVSSGEDLSSQDMIDDNYCEQREESESPEYPSEYIPYNTGPPDCQRAQPVKIQVRSSEEKEGSRKRRAADNEYFEFDWDDELRAEGHLPPLSQPGSRDDEYMESRPHFLIDTESPMSVRHIRQMRLRDGIITDRSESPHYPSNFDDIICEQHETAEMFASSLQQKLEEVSKNRNAENVTDRDHCPSADINPPAHRESACCVELIKRNAPGWNLTLLSVDEEIRTRTRPELLRLLHDVTSFLRELRYDEIHNSRLKVEYRFLRRLARKLKFRLSTYNSVYSPICSCTTISESCAGFVSNGFTKCDRIYCKFTGRNIPVVIFKTYDLPAPWVEMKRELVEKAKSKRFCEQSLLYEEKSLTYAHITPESLPAVKCLLENYFWSNIDVTTIMQYPEFSCAVFYGKLVVGFGYLTPGGHRNEGYINFLFVRPHWRRCGIGGFILYLLRQQCLYWTLTLHVSPKSEALNLYHKFGFKICSRITNFYADYVISNSQGDKDALFMKLESKLPQVY